MTTADSSKRPRGTRGRAPTFSVVVCVYNRCEMLRRALSSVLAQTDQDFEIVVVDDGSTDESGVVAQTVLGPEMGRAKYLRREVNRGIPAARNLGLANAAGRIVTFLDSDDIWHPKYLASIRSGYDMVPDALFVFTNYLSSGPKYAGAVEQLDLSSEIGDPVHLMMRRPFIHTMSCFSAPTRALRAVGGFNERLARFEDIDLYVRLMLAKHKGKAAWESKRIVCVPHFAVMKRIHLQDRDLAAYRQEWDEAKDAFLDELMKLPEIAGLGLPKAEYEASLAVGAAEYFHNFE